LSVVAVYSPKGGVGKTTLSFEMAWRFSSVARRKTLLWDLDPEGGAAFLCKVEKANLISDPYLLQRPLEIRQSIVLTDHDNLFFLGFSEDMRGISHFLTRLGPKRRIEETVANLTGTFDRIVLDCPPVRNEMSDQVMRSADVMITPLPASPISSRALEKVKSEQARSGRTTMPILPVFSMFDSRRKTHQIARTGRMAGYPAIPWSNDIEQIAFKQAPITSFAKASNGAASLNTLWEGIEKKLVEIEAA